MVYSRPKTAVVHSKVDEGELQNSLKCRWRKFEKLRTHIYAFYYENSPKKDHQKQLWFI